MKSGFWTSLTIKNYLKLYFFSLLCCLPFIINFFWGNHDWDWVKNGIPLDSGIFEGRFSQFILPTILFAGNLLPIFPVVLGLGFLSLSAIMLLNLWQIPQKSYLYILLGLNIVITPYLISWFYFAFITLSCLSWTFVIILSYYILQNQTFPKHLSIFFAILLFTLALGGYPPVINMIGVIIFSLILGDLCHTGLSIKFLIKKYLPHIFAIVMSVALLLFIQYELRKHNLQYDTYNTEGLDVKNLLAKLGLCFTSAFKQFVTTTSFVPYFYKYISLCFCFLALIFAFYKLPRKLPHIICFILALMGLLLSSTITLFAAKNTIYIQDEPRIDFFSLPYIYTFAIVLLIQIAPKFIKNITLLFISLLVVDNINNLAYAAKVWKLGFTAEGNFSERFITRLEEHPQFVPHPNRYTFIQGGVLNFRQRFYKQSSHHEKIDSYTLSAPYIPWHLPYKAYTFYYPENFVKKDYDVYWTIVPASAVPFTVKTEKYIEEDATPWPHSQALYVTPRTIIFTMTTDGRNRAIEWKNRYFDIYPQ